MEGRHAKKIQTVETPEASTLVQALSCLFIGSHLAANGLVMCLEFYTLSKCSTESSDDFAGVTAILSTVYSFIGLGTMIVCCCYDMRILSIFLAGLHVLISVFIVVTEAATFKCAQQTAVISPFCTSIRRSLNLCDWISVRDAMTEDAISLGPDELHKVRIFAILLSVLIFLTALISLCTLTCGVKLGDPVYLALKRHRNSIVVGASRNAETANKNKLLNQMLTNARQSEDAFYEKRKKACLQQLIICDEAPSANTQRTHRTGAESNTAKSTD